MRIVHDLLRKIGLLTGAFLVVGQVTTAAVYWSAFNRETETAFDAEIKSATAMAQRSYSNGDLIALRSTLDQLARSSGWASGRFSNQQGDVLWSFASDGTEPSSVLTGGGAVTFDNGEAAGTIAVAKDVSASRVELWRRIFWPVAATTVLWVVFVVIANTLAKAQLRPVLSLMADVRREAERTGVALAEEGADEIATIRGWFAHLATSWLVEHRRSLANERTLAVARTTQMLAHDVRRPFSLLNIGIGLLRKAGDADEVKRVLDKMVPEIDRAVRKVDGLIADVMEVGATTDHLATQPTAVEALIEGALSEVVSLYPGRDIAPSYDFAHTKPVDVHAEKIGRVFANIVANAVQAMGPDGRLWFKTRDVGAMVEFCIGNSGSYIPEADQARLFEAFFTSGKEGGTGLGLAIAQKMVHAHGGDIRCVSTQDLGVEFYFTLRAARTALL